MKRFRFLGVMLAISLCLAIPGLVGAQPRPKTKLPDDIVVKRCADPAAHRIDFRIVSKTRLPTSTGRVRITGVVKNVGPDPYISSDFKPTARLFEGNNPVAVAEQPFGPLLAPGQEMTLVYERHWPPKPTGTPSLPPPAYKLMLGFPKETTAGGPTADCNPSNNVKERSGEEINALFRGSTP